MGKLYTKDGRLADVMALIQVLALDGNTHRSEDGLRSELQGDPKSGVTWKEIAGEHPEFFRTSDSGSYKVSLVCRHVLPRNESGHKENPSSDFIVKLLETAINLHDRDVSRQRYWHAYIPIIVSVITVLGAFLSGWFLRGSGA